NPGGHTIHNLCSHLGLRLGPHRAAGLASDGVLRGLPPACGAFGPMVTRTAAPPGEPWCRRGGQLKERSMDNQADQPSGGGADPSGGSQSGADQPWATTPHPESGQPWGSTPQPGGDQPWGGGTPQPGGGQPFGGTPQFGGQ